MLLIYPHWWPEATATSWESRSPSAVMLLSTPSNRRRARPPAPTAALSHDLRAPRCSYLPATPGGCPDCVTISERRDALIYESRSSWSHARRPVSHDLRAP